MATEKKPEQELTVEQRLKALYKLQTILTEIDRIRTIRGELPLEVSDLEDNIAGLQTRVENYTRQNEDLRRKTAAEKEKITQARNLIAHYTKQLDDVSNNREFDNLTKEIEYQNLEIELSEKHLGEYARTIDSNNEEIARTEQTLADNRHILEEKKSELSEIVSETKQDEERLLDEAQALEPSIDERTLKAFKRIRGNAHNGLGIVYIQRNACGGCFNRIPPQRQMEIKMHKKVIVCEYCGRIMIDPELAGVEVPAETVPKSRVSRTKIAPAE